MAAAATSIDVAAFERVAAPPVVDAGSTEAVELSPVPSWAVPAAVVVTAGAAEGVVDGPPCDAPLPLLLAASPAGAVEELDSAALMARATSASSCVFRQMVYKIRFGGGRGGVGC